MKIRYFFIRYLANLQFAILLLLSIAGLSTIGSVIEQNQSIEFYQKNYTAGLGLDRFFNSTIILQFGLDHIFRTWWFISLLVLFGTSLTCCTFLQQFPILTAARKFKFYNSEKNFTALPFKTKAAPISNGSLITVLEKSNYQSFQRSKGLYSNKGMIGRISPVIVHFSMVLILFGTVLASLAGFVAQEFVPETEIFHVQNLLTTNINSFVPQLAGRVNDFWIIYKDDQIVTQFYTDLSILDNQGKELKRETIYINHPLKYKGLTFYQTDWDILGLRIQFDNSQPNQIPVLKPTKKIWLSWLPTSSNQDLGGSGYTLLNTVIRGSSPLYDKAGQLIGEGELNEGFPGYENTKLCEFINATGIQIKADPGLSVIYAGFFLLLISILTSYTSYSQVWLSRLNNQVVIGGLTNRAKIQFEFEILNLGLQLQKLENIALSNLKSSI
jgi:cytochrome c biogenesis protein